MRRFLRRKKGIALLATLVVVGAAAFGAYAFFTSSGSGTGTATVGHDTAFVLHGSTTGFAYPGQSQVVTLTVDNNGSGNQQIGLTHHIYLASVVACDQAFTGTTCAAGHEVTTCESTGDGSLPDTGANALDNWYMADVLDTTDYAPGAGQGAPNGSLAMNDLTTSQDNCKNAHLLLNLSTR